MDGLGNIVPSDLFAVDGSGDETFLERFTGAISIPGGFDLSTLGYPSATFRVKPVPAFNRDYTVTEIEIVHSTDVEVVELGALVFQERVRY